MQTNSERDKHECPVGGGSVFLGNTRSQEEDGGGTRDSQTQVGAADLQNHSSRTDYAESLLI